MLEMNFSETPGAVRLRTKAVHITLVQGRFPQCCCHQNGARRWPQGSSSRLRPAVEVTTPLVPEAGAASATVAGAVPAAPEVTAGEGEGVGLLATQVCTVMHSCWLGS